MAALGARIEAGKSSSAVNPQEKLVAGSRQDSRGLAAELRAGPCEERTADWAVAAGSCRDVTKPRNAAPRISAAEARAESRTVPWWLWWNILSVDAPMVAVAWAGVFAGAAGGRLAGVDATVLF